MVVFTCSACGDSVKKPQVEKHLYRRCRGATLCCIDCLKDFYGDEYKGHNSCITENERYGGKNYVAKPNENKGAQKQQLWFEKVLNAIEKIKNTQSPWIQRHLEKLKNYPNIPSKKAKFEAFLKNSLAIYDNKAVSQIWNAIDQNIEKQTPQTNKQNGQAEVTNISKDKQAAIPQDIVVEKDIETEQKDAEKKLSKRERKEERRKQAHKKEKKDLNTSEPMNGDSDELHEKKKKKKRKHQEAEVIENHAGKKRKFDEIDENQEPMNGEQEQHEEEGGQEPSNEEEEEEPAKKRFKTKFDWSGVIIEVLQGKDSEIKIKKLRKKVLAEYLAQGCTEKSEERLWAKFEKKLKKTPQVRVQNDRVKLKVL